MQLLFILMIILPFLLRIARSRPDSRRPRPRGDWALSDGAALGYNNSNNKASNCDINDDTNGIYIYITFTLHLHLHLHYNYITIRHVTLHYSTLHYSTLQYIAVYYSTLQYIAYITQH